MANTAATSPGTVASVNTGVGLTAWTNPTNAAASDNAYATVASNAISGSLSHQLRATNFPFAIPGTATIDGILVEVEAKSSNGTSTLIEAFLINGSAGSAADQIGTDQITTDITVATTDAYYTVGGASSLWGATLTPAIINGANFGVGIRADAKGSPPGNFRTIFIDHIRMTVYYTIAASAPKVFLSFV
jgi:hypothetical protein